MVKKHHSAIVSNKAHIGEKTIIWHFSHIRKNVTIGRNCIIGQSVYIDSNVKIGNNVKIQNGCYLYHGSNLEDGVFLGPAVILTNDRIPRAINPDGSLKNKRDWQAGKILIKKGASLGTGVIVLPNITIGKFAMIAAGSVVTKNVPDQALVMGIPARNVGFVCICGETLRKKDSNEKRIKIKCKNCGNENLL